MSESRSLIISEIVSHLGEIPTGYSLEVREHSEKFHKIKLEDVRSRRVYSDLHQLYSDIAKFLKVRNLSSCFDVSLYVVISFSNAYISQDQAGNSPPLFTMYDDVFQNTSLTAVENTLKTLWQTEYSPGKISIICTRSTRSQFRSPQKREE